MIWLEVMRHEDKALANGQLVSRGDRAVMGEGERMRQVLNHCLCFCV